MSASTPVLLYYPTGIVHLGHLAILKKQFPQFRFLVIIEPWIQTSATKFLDAIDIEDQVVVESNRLPEEIWANNINILLLNMAAPNLFRLYLVTEALNRDITTIALEEVNQLALNDGIINHYFMPVEYMGVPSTVEKERFTRLGVPDHSIHVIGWPYFNEENIGEKPSFSGYNLREEYGISAETKCCLLVLGSLKERDIVSLESSIVRRKILKIVREGLETGYKLLIKPHPIETAEGLENIKNMVPDAIIVDPKYPIEPLLTQTDLVVNRGNSQVVLLAMVLNKPLIILPEGLRTIFHQQQEEIIANSASQFKQILLDYAAKRTWSYQKILSIHFPYSQNQSLSKLKELFLNALQQKKVHSKSQTRLYISILYAFLGEKIPAKEILTQEKNNEVAALLDSLYDYRLEDIQFKELFHYFPEKIIRWHLQALFIRGLFSRAHNLQLSSSLPLLESFTGDVNPHYFIDDIIKRIELEFRAGRRALAEELLERFSDDYSVFDYYREAFNMLRYVYLQHQNGAFFFKILWLLFNLNKGYSRKYVKEKIQKFI